MSRPAMILIAVLVLAAGTLFWLNPPKPRTARSAATTDSQAQATQESRARLVVKVDGDVEEAPRFEGNRTMADLPFDEISTSHISYVRADGASYYLVMMDGSERWVDAGSVDRLPASVAYRLKYDRGE